MHKRKKRVKVNNVKQTKDMKEKLSFKYIIYTHIHTYVGTCMCAYT